MVVGLRRPLAGDLVEQTRHAVLLFDRIVVQKHQLRHMPQSQPLTELSLQKGAGAAQCTTASREPDSSARTV